MIVLASWLEGIAGTGSVCIGLVCIVGLACIGPVCRCWMNCTACSGAGFPCSRTCWGHPWIKNYASPFYLLGRVSSADHLVIR